MIMLFLEQHSIQPISFTGLQFVKFKLTLMVMCFYYIVVIHLLIFTDFGNDLQLGLEVRV